MNPWIDVFGWALLVACLIFLRYEIPRAVREIRKILSEARAVQQHISRGQMMCPTCETETDNRFWYRCPCCGSNHQPV